MPAHLDPRPDETFEARAYSHLGTLLASEIASTPQGVQRAIEAALGERECYCITIRGEYTSDGSKWPNHSGRVCRTWDKWEGWRAF